LTRSRKGPGTVRKDWFDTEEEAWEAGEKLKAIKEQKGYQSILAKL